eukprot:13307405-Alexandrium_andersonii.AAC.1
MVDRLAKKGRLLVRGRGAVGRAPAERFGKSSWLPRSGASGSTSIGPARCGACVGRLLMVKRRGSNQPRAQTRPGWPAPPASPR